MSRPAAGHIGAVDQPLSPQATEGREITVLGMLRIASWFFALLRRSTTREEAQYSRNFCIDGRNSESNYGDKRNTPRKGDDLDGCQEAQTEITVGAGRHD